MRIRLMKRLKLYNSRQRPIDGLDMVRIVATIMIFSCHYSVALKQYQISGFYNFGLYSANADSGKVGVYLFFMLSGYLLIMKYKDGISVVEFYKKRWLSIFPSYYVSYFFCALVLMALREKNVTDFLSKKIVWTLVGMDSYLSADFSTTPLVGEWFTGAIILLYLLFPVLCFLYKNLLTFYLTSIFALSCYITTWYIYPLPHPTGVESIFSDLLYFWGGCVIFHERENIKKINTLVILFALTVLNIKINTFDDLTNSLVVAIGVFIICIQYSEDIKRVCLSNQNKLYGIIINRGLYIVLQHSFFIYLLHHRVIYLLMEQVTREMFFCEKVLLYVVSLLITCMCAYLLQTIMKSVRNIIKKGIINLRK